MPLQSGIACSRHVPLSAPIDRYFPKTGIRLRHLPGEVCLACGDVHAPPVAPSHALERDITLCLAGDPGRLVVVKSRPLKESLSTICNQCGGPEQPANVDVALGENLGLIIEDVEGRWCGHCRSVCIADDGLSVRQRLAALRLNDESEHVPSLIYDTPSHPRSIQFEVTTRCNLKCEYCSHRYLESKQDIPFERFLGWLNRIRLEQVDNVDFTGLGEAVLHPQLAAMVGEVRRRAAVSDIRIVTNGIALLPKRFEPLCDAGVTSFAFSIDSLDPERFARQRGGGKLSIALDNLKALVQYRERRDLTGLQIKIKSVLIDEPEREAERLMRFSAELGLEMPHFSCLDSRLLAQQRYTASWLTENWGDMEKDMFLLAAERRWREITGGKDPYLRPDTKMSEYIHPALLPQNLCRWAVDAAFVASTGDCLSCCEQMIDLPRTHFGQLGEKTMEQLWREDLVWGYRLPLSLGLLPRGCVGCPRAPEHGQPIEETQPAGFIQVEQAAPRSGHTSLQG